MSTLTIARGSYGVPSPLISCAAFVLCVTFDDGFRSKLWRLVAIWLAVLGAVKPVVVEAIGTMRL